MALTAAQQVYGTNTSGPMALIPRAKYNFTLELEINPPPNDLGIKSEIIKVLRVESAQLPSITNNTMVVNQYNVKRAVSTKIDYDPITLRFYDTNDSQILNILRVYYSTYFNERGLEFSSRILQNSNSVIVDEFSTDMGRQLPEDRYRYFFRRIKIIQHGETNRSTGFQKTRTTLIETPAIMNMTMDTLTYAESSPAMITLVLQPERFLITDQEVDRNNG